VKKIRATFLIDEDIWQKFRAISITNKTNASKILNKYIEKVVKENEKK
jgi:hypothetical protein